VYHIEIMRSQMGQCSFILRYFVNQGVNASKLVGCMEEIGNQVSLDNLEVIGLVYRLKNLTSIF
jgi:hypothetical protein